MLSLVLLTLSTAGVPPVQDPAPPAPGRLVLRDVTVIDVRAGERREHRTVTIEGGRVLSVEELGGEPVPPPPGTEVVLGEGRFVIPGLWDMHVHMLTSPRFPELFLAHGVTGVRDMFGLEPVAPLRARLESGELLGPRMAGAGRILDGNPPYWPGSLVARDAAEGRAAVAELSLGSDFVKVYSRLSREAYFAIAEECRGRGFPFDGHVPWGVRAREAALAGQRCIEHLSGVIEGCSTEEERMVETGLTRSGRLRLALDTYDPARAAELCALFRERGTWHCPTLTVLRALGSLDDPEFTADPRLESLPPFWKGVWDPRQDRRFQAYEAEDWALARETFAKSLELVGLLHAAGVPLLAGTDCANPYCFPGSGLHDELELLVRAGLTPADALRAAIWNPAVFLGRSAELGTVEAGKLADLVVLDADPLADIGHVRAVWGVVRGGRWLAGEARSELLEGRAR